MYETGRGVKQSNRDAAAWFARAARKGEPEAQYRLGLMYRDGRGVEQSKTISREWLQKAANKGHSGAKQALKEF